MPPVSTSLQPRRRPTQARGRERVKRILAAAQSLLEAGSAEGVTMAAIARRAELPIGSLYQYFPNRLAVLAELARRSLETVDREAIGELEDVLARPWREAVDRVVEAHVAALQRRSMGAQMLRTLAPSREFLEIDDESNARFARALAAHPALAACGGPAERARIARVAVEAAAAVEAFALRAGSAAETRILTDEMKRLIKAYLAVHIEGSPDADPGSGDAPVPR